MRINLISLATWGQVALVEVIFNNLGQPLLFVGLSDPFDIAAGFVVLGRHLLIGVKDEGQCMISCN